MSIITDNSTPLTLNSAQNLAIINSINSNKQSFINSNMLSNILIPYITSNVFENKSNILNTAINTKQNILTASTSLLGDGSAITNISYGNITGKPINFQADWNSTIINKPTIYTQTEVNNLLSAKEQNLTFNAPLTRTTNTIGINLNSYTPFSALIQSNYITNATSGLNNYYDKNTSDGKYTQSNFTPSFTQLNSCNYITNATTGLLNYPSYSALTLSNYANYTQLNSCNYITNATSGLTNYTTSGNDTHYLKKIGGDMTGNINMTSTSILSFGQREGDNHIKLWTDGTNNYGFGINPSTLRYNTPTGASHKFYSGATNTAIINSSGNITATSFTGDGANITNVPYSTITGKPSIFNPDLTNIYTKNEINLISNLSNFYNKTSTDTLLNAKENVLTFNSPLNKTGSTISINLNSYTPFTALSQSNYATYNGLLSSNYATYSGLLSSNYVNFNQLNSCNYITNSTSSLTNYYDKITSDARYLQLSGGTMNTGANIITTGNIRSATSTIGDATYQVYINPPTSTSASLIQTIQQGVGFNQNLTFQTSGGNVGIGITNPSSKLYVNGNTTIKGIANIHNGTPYAVNNNKMAAGSLTIGDTLFDYGGGNLWTTNTAGLLFECLNNTEIAVHDASHRVASLMYYQGGGTNTITIGRNMGWDAISSVNVMGNLSSTGYMYAGGTTSGLRINGNDYGNTIYQGATTISGNPANIGFTLRDDNSFKFQSFSTGGVYTTLMTLNSFGLYLYDKLIYNYLFNNTGQIHSSTSDFNSITQFGYRFIQGNTNGPTGIDNTLGQSYSWYIGIGSQYPASGADSYGAQFAIPRNTSYPVMSVRFKENNSWGGWTGITAERLRIKTDQWNYSSEGNQRLYCGTSSTTYYQGYGNTDFSINHDFRNHDGSSKLVLYYGGTTNAGAKLYGQFTCGFYTIANTNRDLLGINIEGTSTGNYNNTTIYCIQGTFTGFHRCFTEDELFDKDKAQSFKDNYEGRIVVSTGKIATDTNETNKEWEIKYDKDGITIEDALPQIELSRKKKDKRVFGVLGDKRRNNSRQERLIVNSVGEGAIWVCNSNGNIENGDYIQSSDYLGYGEKQDDDLLHNYTCAKATMDCSFELDSPLYECKEIDDLDADGNRLRVAFIAVSYHCG